MEEHFLHTINTSVIFQFLKQWGEKKGAFFSDEIFRWIASYYICYHYIVLYSF